MASHPSDVVVRVAGDADLVALASLRATWSRVDQVDPAFVEQMAAWLAAEGDHRTTWLATAREEPVGMASVFEYRRMPRPARPYSRWGYVSNMFVLEAFRGRGIGSALLAAIIDTAQQRDYTRLVLSPSPRAVSFYLRAGFVVPDEAAANDRLLVRRQTAPDGHLPSA